MTRPSLHENHQLTAPQILLHPYVWAKYKALVEYCHDHAIIVEAYSGLTCAISDPSCADH